MIGQKLCFYNSMETQNKHELLTLGKRPLERGWMLRAKRIYILIISLQAVFPILVAVFSKS